MLIPRIKFCGFTRAEDIKLAVQLGVDAVGFVNYPKSRRHIGIEEIGLLMTHIPAFVDTVVLLVNTHPNHVRRVIHELAPTYLQFHGDEPPEYCEQFNYPYLRAIRVGATGIKTPQQIAEYALSYKSAKAFIFDAFTPDFGGSGKQFNHELLDEVKQILPAHKIMIAGGVNSDNVGAIIAHERPYAIDLSSGLEDDIPGVKNPDKMQAFMQLLAAIRMDLLR